MERRRSPKVQACLKSWISKRSIKAVRFIAALFPTEFTTKATKAVRIQHRRCLQDSRANEDCPICWDTQRESTSTAAVSERVGGQTKAVEAGIKISFPKTRYLLSCLVDMPQGKEILV